MATGARDIDMVDLKYADPHNIIQLAERVRVVDPQAAEHNGTIQFTIDVGNGIEIVTLHTVSVGIEKYTPNSKLSGVLEFLGPTKLNTRNLVVPNIANQLENESIIANFDVALNDLRPTAILKPLTEGDFTVYKITDQPAFVQSLQHNPQPAHVGPSIASLREAAHVHT